MIGASTDASQEENLEEEVSTKSNHIKEPKPRTGTVEPRTSIDADSNKIDKEKRKLDELPKTYKSKVSVPQAVEAESSRKKKETCNKELMKLFKQVYTNLSLLDAI